MKPKFTSKLGVLAQPARTTSSRGRSLVAGIIGLLAVCVSSHWNIASAQGGPDEAAGNLDITTINMQSGQVMLEFVGQMIDLPTDLPRSNQFGYLSFIKGVDPIFFFQPNEATALFRFSAQATTTQELTNGPLRIINRKGMMSIFFNPCPPCLSPSADFANPASPIPAILIQMSTLRQQMIVDTVEQSFTVTNVSTITDTRPFMLGSTQFELGQVGQIFRASLSGRLDPVSLTKSYFAGYAVGVATQ